MEFTARAKKIIDFYSQVEGRRLSSSILEPEHLLLGILKEPESFAMKILSRLGTNFDVLKRNIDSALKYRFPSQSSFGPIPVSSKFSRIIDFSKEEAKQAKNPNIGTEHVLLALFRDAKTSGITGLIEAGITYEIIKMETERLYNTKDGNSVRAKGGTNKPFSLSDFTIDLTQRSRDGLLDPVIGREHEIERTVRILCRKTKNNPLLIGEAGVGKTAIVEGLAQKIVAGGVPDILAGKRILSFDMAGIVAGTKYRGEFEDRLKKLIMEVSNSKDIIIFIDEIHTIIGAGAAEGTLDAANILKPVLARGEIRCIGATTNNEYKKYIEKDAALERRFQTVTVKEPSEDDVIKILQGIKPNYEKHHNVFYDEESIIYSVKLASRYIQDRYMPDKAVDVFDEAGVKARLENAVKPSEISDIEAEIDRLISEKNEYVKAQEYEKAASLRDMINDKKGNLARMLFDWENKENTYRVVVTKQHVSSVVSQWSGVPVERLEESESLRLLRLEDELKKRIIGQDDAIAEICNAIRRTRTGLRRQNRPIGSFIFAGPTGVGKTELAKAVAEVIFGDKNSLVRLDMSEFMEKHSVSRLIGSPPGYIGFDRGGQLTDKVRRRPYSVILFDEIEKAHQDVFNVLLQIMDEGELTDNLVGTVSFRDTIIIMTSNVGNSKFDRKSAMGFSGGDIEYTSRDKTIDSVKALFNSEFLNRVDEIVYFHRLDKNHVRQIVKIMLDEISSRMSERNIDLIFTKSVIDLACEDGFSTEFGARYLRKFIQDRVENALALEILSGKITDGSTVKVSFKSGSIRFRTDNQMTEDEPKNDPVSV